MNDSDMNILVVAAHPDDEVLGCCGTITKHADSGCRVDVVIVGEGVTSRADQEEESAKKQLGILRRSAEKAGQILGANSVTLLGLPDN